MKNVKILLVEDDPFLVDIYTTKFKKEGWEVKNVTNGEEALDLLKEEKFDLLILDIVLPHKSGWEVLKEIKSNDSFKNLKVVILSNLGQKKEVEKGLKMGAVEYIIKAHHTPGQVLEKIKKVLKEYGKL